MVHTRRSMFVFPVFGWLTATATAQDGPAAAGAAIPASFPSHEPALAREMVGVSHGNVARVRELLSGRPALAKAAWDWGYGDWETALGAASHIGHRAIAELLLRDGAAPTLFSAAMLGQLDIVKATVDATPGVQRMKGPHGITLAAHARAGGPAAAAVLRYLESLGDANARDRDEPLTDADRHAVVGAYALAHGAGSLTVAMGARGLGIQRDGSVERTLIHLGGRVFHPAGANAVRIRLQGSAERAVSLTVEDGPLVVTARRVG